MHKRKCIASIPVHRAHCLKKAGMESSPTPTLGIPGKHQFLGYTCQTNVFDIVLRFQIIIFMRIKLYKYKFFARDLCLYTAEGCSNSVFITYIKNSSC